MKICFIITLFAVILPGCKENKTAVNEVKEYVFTWECQSTDSCTLENAEFVFHGTKVGKGRNGIDYLMSLDIEKGSKILIRNPWLSSKGRKAILAECPGILFQESPYIRTNLLKIWAEKKYIEIHRLAWSDVENEGFQALETVKYVFDGKPVGKGEQGIRELEAVNLKTGCVVLLDGPSPYPLDEANAPGCSRVPPFFNSSLMEKWLREGIVLESCDSESKSSSCPIYSRHALESR